MSEESPLEGFIEYRAYHRMKADLETRLSQMEAELWDAKKLIAELADALDPSKAMAADLLQRAREAGKDE